MAQRPQSTMPGWMKLLFLIFIGYVLYVGNFTSGTAPVATPINTVKPRDAGPAIPKPENAASTEQHYSELRNFLDAGRWKRALNPEYAGKPDVKELQRGSGSAAGCGSKVSVRYRGTLPNGANFDGTHDERDVKTFVLGQAPLAAMNEGLVGMQAGGVRQLKAGQHHVFKKSSKTLDSILFRIEMETLSPTSPVDSQPFAMMQVKAPVSDVLSQAQCGEMFEADLVWFDEKGHVSKRETRAWALGDGSMAAGLDRAAHGMRKDEVRFAVLPPAWHDLGDAVASVLIIRTAASN